MNRRRAATAMGFGFGSETLLIFALVLGPVLVASAGAWGAGIADAGLTAIFGPSVAFLFAAWLTFSELESATVLLVIPPEWVVMTAVAGLFLPRDQAGD